MKRFCAVCFVGLILFGGVVGCEKKNEVKKETTVTTPEGETTTTQSSKVERSGENPPAPQR